MRPTDELPVIFADKVQSLNYTAPTPPSVFAGAGTLVDLTNGDIVSTGLAVDGTTGDVAVRGDITATSLALLESGATRATFDALTPRGYSGHGFTYYSPEWTDPDTAAYFALSGGNTGGNDRAGVDLVVAGPVNTGGAIYIDVSNATVSGYLGGYGATPPQGAYVSFSQSGGSSVIGMYANGSDGWTIIKASSGAGTGSVVEVTADTFQVGDSPGYRGIEVYSLQSNMLRLIENGTTLRPYMSWYNRDASGNVDRKGYIGYPENLSNSSTIYLTSDQGKLKLTAATEIELASTVSTGGGVQSPTNSAPAASKLIKSHTNGYVYVGWLNTVSGSYSGTPSRIYASNDRFVRYMTLANFRSKVASYIAPCNPIDREYDSSSTKRAGTWYTVTLSSTVGGVSMSGAKGVFANITVASAAGSGFLEVRRRGGTTNGSWSNYTASNLPAANQGFVPIDSSRRFQFRAVVSNVTRIIVDVYAVVF